MLAFQGSKGHARDCFDHHVTKFKLNQHYLSSPCFEHEDFATVGFLSVSFCRNTLPMALWGSVNFNFSNPFPASTYSSWNLRKSGPWVTKPTVFLTIDHRLFQGSVKAMIPLFMELGNCQYGHLLNITNHYKTLSLLKQALVKIHTFSVLILRVCKLKP